MVGRMKRVMGTDKAVLILADEHGAGLDLDSMVVRGILGQHLQDWWFERLERLGDVAFRTGNVVVEAHPEHRAWLLCAPVRVRNRPLGLLGAINPEERPFLNEQIDFAAILSAFAATAIENARLAEQSRYVMLASERDRIAREMHDGVVQSLFSVSLGMELCKKQALVDSEGAVRRLDLLQGQLNSAMTELRRFIYDLRPMKLKELGLVGAIEYWVREVTTGREIHGKVVTSRDLPRMSPSEEACLYSVTKEAVSNVVKHSSAKLFEVKIDSDGDMVMLQVIDDGCGITSRTTGAEPGQPGLGIDSMRERVSREGGRVSIDQLIGGGTRVAVEIRTGVSR